LINTEPRQLILHYSSLADRLLASLEVTGTTLTGEFLEDMRKTPIFREYLHFFKTGEARVLKYILTFLYFGKKMNYEDNDLKAAAFRSWLEIEREMDDFTPPTSVVRLLGVIIPQLIGSFDDTLLYPKHGPGSTSEGYVDPNDKLEHLSFDAKSLRVFRPESFGRFGVDRASLAVYANDRVEKEQVAGLRFVPKNVKTMRSICMEPIGRMLLQQEVMRWLVDAIKHGPLRSIVDLADQEQSRHYARCCSFSFAGDTIDLSAASDRIHVKLIRAVFPKRVLYYLLGTRTHLVDTENGTLALNKFAPMGSAVCFPVQCILFSALTLIAYLMHHYEVDDVDDLSEDLDYVRNVSRFLRKHTHDNPGESLPGYLRPRVYGDDIICDYRTTDSVLDLLTRSGLVVNEEKSFIGGSLFRESCGIFAFNGEDVTPVLFRVKPLGRMLDASSFMSLIEQANRAGDHQLRAVRSCIINYIKRAKIGGLPKVKTAERLPWSSVRTGYGLYTNNPHKSAKVQWNADYQRTEHEVLVLRAVKSRRKPADLAEYYAYDQWARARMRGGSIGFSMPIARIRPSDTRVRLGWTPA
jgi:hypothetical protein